MVRVTSVVGHSRSSIRELTEFSISPQDPVARPSRSRWRVRPSLPTTCPTCSSCRAICWLVETISLKVSAILPRTPVDSPAMRTEKSPIRIAWSARSNSWSSSPWAAPFAGVGVAGPAGICGLDAGFGLVLHGALPRHAQTPLTGAQLAVEFLRREGGGLRRQAAPPQYGRLTRPLGQAHPHLVLLPPISGLIAHATREEQVWFQPAGARKPPVNRACNGQGTGNRRAVPAREHLYKRERFLRSRICRPVAERRELCRFPKRLLSHLPYLRRFARAATGSQKSGDAYVASVLEAILADPTILPEDRFAARGPLPNIPENREFDQMERPRQS